MRARFCLLSAPIKLDLLSIWLCSALFLLRVSAQLPWSLKLQVYLWILEFLKVKWESDPSVIRPLSCGTSCHFEFRMQTPSLSLRLGLKPSFFTKLIVKDGSGDPETSHSRSAINLDCWGTSHYAPLLTLLSFTLNSRHLFFNQYCTNGLIWIIINLIELDCDCITMNWIIIGLNWINGPWDDVYCDLAIYEKKIKSHYLSFNSHVILWFQTLNLTTLCDESLSEKNNFIY